MKKYSLIILLSLVSFLGFSQDALRAIGKITYISAVTAMGSLQNNGHTSLYFNADRSLYIHDDAPKKDTFMYYKDIESSGDVSGDPTGFPIFKLHKEKRLLFKQFFFPYSNKNLSIISDTFATTQWILIPDSTKQFGSFTCEKATGHFRGRDYEVWYAPDIPIPSGPFKLGGLPGLIFEARSTDKKVQFLFNSIEISNNIEQKIEFPPGGVDTQKTYAEAIEKIYAVMKQFEDEAAANGSTMTMSMLETIELNAKN
jgi:GLPGLI family protein